MRKEHFRLRWSPTISILAILFSAVFSHTGTAQSISAQLPANKTATHLPEFDVVSIKLNKTGLPTGLIAMASDSDKLVVTNIPMQRLVAFAYNFRRYTLVSGSPDWAKSERYDMVATVAASDLDIYHSLTDDQRKAMLQVVLADRCKLKVHLQPTEAPIYALVIAKNGPKMRAAKPGDPLPEPDRGPDGKPTHEELLFRHPGELRGLQIPMASLALALSSSGLDRQVIDKTGLPGKYDFTLQWTPEPSLGPSGPNTSPSAESSSPLDPSRPFIFTAIQEQLGLKLEPTKGLIQSLVVDHIEKPSEN